MLGGAESVSIIQKNLYLSGMKPETSTYIVDKRNMGKRGVEDVFL